MKTTKKLFILIFVVLLMLNTTVFAQDEAKKPEYITVTTMHWNMDQENFSMDTWKSVEKEYLEKVTKRNEFIIGTGFFLHQFTDDNTELIYVQSYASWNDIDKAGDRNGELAKEVWPDDDARKAFFKKRNNYYSTEHSDEIYATISGAKPMMEDPGKDLTVYVQRRHFAFPEDGTQKEFKELRDEYVEKVIHKNEFVKAYYPSVHAWGADRTEYIEAFYVDSLADLDKMLDQLGVLSKEAWPDEAARKERGKKVGKYFTGVHGDKIYTFVSGLAK